jgi:hypothetical protein
MTPTTDTNEPGPCHTKADVRGHPSQASDHAGHFGRALQAGVTLRQTACVAGTVRPSPAHAVAGTRATGSRGGCSRPRGAPPSAEGRSAAQQTHAQDSPPSSSTPGAAASASPSGRLPARETPRPMTDDQVSLGRAEAHGTKDMDLLKETPPDQVLHRASAAAELGPRLG